MQNFGVRLRTARKRRGISQTGLADLMKVHRASVARWERGDDVPSARTFALLSESLEVYLYWLLGMTESPHRIILTPQERELLLLYREFPETDKALFSEAARDIGRVRRLKEKARPVP